MSRLLWIVLGVPLGIVLVALGVANREPLTVSLDPFRPANPALSIHPPLFLAFFAVLIAGVLIGGIAVWISHYKVRRALHRARLEIGRLQSERPMGESTAAQPSGQTLSGQKALAGPRRVA